MIFTLLFVNSGISQQGWIDISVGSSDYKGVFFIEKDLCYAIRNDGIVLNTSNLGNNWSSLNTNSTNILTGNFTNSMLGVLWSNPAKLTTNGGIKWITISNDVNAMGTGFVNGITFINDSIGFAVGMDFYPIPVPCCIDGIINKSTNSGQNWVEVFRSENLQLEDVKFKTSEDIKVLASIGLLTSTNGGANWVLDDQLFKDIPFFHAKSMTDPFNDTIFVAGYVAGDTAVVASTLDGGGHWIKTFQMNSLSRFRKLDFVNNQVGFAIGDTGLIAGTVNGGMNWQVQTSGTVKRLSGVSFINKDTGFVVGDSGLILKTFTGGITNISNSSLESPNDYELHQNYPNPFNPTTIISFFASKSSKMKLRIFDTSGKLVENLFSGIMSSGIHKKTWDARNYPAGLYFVTLQTNNFFDVKKMILLK